MVPVSSSRVRLPRAPRVVVRKTAGAVDSYRSAFWSSPKPVLEVVEYRKNGPEVVVANGFGPDSDWVRNIQARQDEEVTVGSQHFAASHRFLGEEEAMAVIRHYEHRNRLIAPMVRAGFSWLLGWKYSGSESDRRRLVGHIPLLAFRRRS